MKYLTKMIFIVIALPCLAQEYPHDYAAAEKLGISEDDLWNICEFCTHDYKPVSGLPIAMFEEAIWLAEMNGRMPTSEVLDSIHIVVKEAWLKKYSQLTCRFAMDISGFGPLDFMSVRFGQQSDYLKLYDPQGDYKISPNTIRGLYSRDREFTGTLVDYLDLEISSNADSARIERWRALQNQLISYGGKRMSEMTAEEIEQNRK